MNSSHIISLIKKEIFSEWKEKFAFNGLMLFAAGTTFICYLSFKNVVDIPAWNALLWIILLFTSINTSAKGFLSESRQRLLYYYQLTSPQNIIVSKMIYASLLNILIALITLSIYSLLNGNPVQDITVFIITIVLGTTGLACQLTMISAIAGKASGNTTMVSILGLPVIIPMISVIIKLSKNAADGLAWSVNQPLVLILIALNIIVGTLSYILFPYLWRD